jgi:hypothetical protein
LNADWNSQFFPSHTNQPVCDRSFRADVSWGGNKNPNGSHCVPER